MISHSPELIAEVKKARAEGFTYREIAESLFPDECEKLGTHVVAKKLCNDLNRKKARITRRIGVAISKHVYSPEVLAKTREMIAKLERESEINLHNMASQSLVIE